MKFAQKKFDLNIKLCLKLAFYNQILLPREKRDFEMKMISLKYDLAKFDHSKVSRVMKLKIL